ncbi:DUF2339 domain-containing protein [Stenotrophomonas sp. Marseille-Q4652]|uniref:DUF2339 domain-containing protein n=1 Tax=Stenotrophomonas sp. Marseille-Q4652 TaxID=2866595 RepID=UPI001CE3EF85|nr:DUF2339 domain-containing protein [Stenotrophomonas sp. Marseille-Q4652]
MESIIALVALAVLAVPVLLGVLAFSLLGLKRRVQLLEQHVAALQARPQPEAAPPAAWTVASSIQPPPAPAPAPAQPAPVSPPPLPATSPLVQAREMDAGAATPPPHAERSRRQPERPGPLQRLLGTARRWFTEGNMPVKVGMLVLLAGVAALLKYASDQGWLNLPIALRLSLISIAALAGLVFAWRKRDSHRTFALALQGGAIGVLLLTVFAACRNHGLIGTVPAFGISVVLIAGLAVMAVLQESRTLAVLGVLAGFMAPVWLSDGSGNHVSLFSYYALLNAGVFAIAWVRPWRELNLLGFVFTWGIGTVWGVLDYAPHKLASTEPFLLLFFAFYLLLPLLHARRSATPGSARVDGALLFGTPLVAFSLQAALLEGERMPLALCALALAALYALLGWLLIRRERFQVLARGNAILAVGFATLAVPLALSARATAAVFALEGAGLVWLGLLQRHRLARWTGIGLQLAAAVALASGVASGPAPSVAITNAAFMGALLVALAGFATAWLYRNASHAWLAAAAYVWGLGWWLGNIALEISNFMPAGSRLHGLLLLLGVTGWVAAEVHRRAPAPALALTTLAALVLAFPLAFAQAADYGQPFAGHGSWVWPVFAALGLRSLLCLRMGEGRIAGLVQLAWWLLWPTVLSLLALHVSERFGLAEGWVGMLLALPWLVMAVLSQDHWRWLAQPLGTCFVRLRPHLQGIVALVLALWWFAALASSGAAAPLPWVALLNPLDLAQVAVLVLAARWLWQNQPGQSASAWRVGLALAALALVTVMTLRAVHHWGGEPWSDALLGSRLAQTSLTVVWSLLGVAGWVSGSRRGQWGLWLSGAILMGVVLAKLLLVDRGNLGDLLGIGAFIAYGLLCTLVGWLAPAPPRRGGANEEASA